MRAGRVRDRRYGAQAAWMVAASVGSWLATAAFVDGRTAVDLLLGMLGPALAVSGTWVLTEQEYRRHPERLTSVMVMAFAGKMVFFGAYVAVMVGVVSVGLVPFIVSFTGYFIALYGWEALLLRRMR